MKDYIKWIRSKVGHETIILNFSGACITNERGEILLQKRSDKEELWGFPGGALEIGESIEEAMIREVKEETGLDVNVEYLIGVYSKYFSKYPNGDSAQSIVYFFKCNVASGDLVIDNKETFDLRFFDKNNIPKLFIQQHTDMLNDYLQDRKGVFK
ncbi:NUDIX hydrolase [Oceanirhabdus sp. W0125-5]|uniref:NUDIX hydrolase n=1 Tax=Oceanirhabdus sp. W0125-5 TaxID=2999116 RepID=UPI0022F341BF|nr:NUDIX hydrolase [Oceanirhabdus sp. W0125-5]WBW94938.1 NUDIX hydrolase [Oceanirhabdus sp. W0125-5]